MEKITNPLYPGALFLIGIIFAMLSGYSLQILYFRQAVAVSGLTDFWDSVENEGMFDQGKYRKALLTYNKVFRLGWLPPTLGWLSGLAFAIAAMISGLSASEHYQNSAAKMVLEFKLSH